MRRVPRAAWAILLLVACSDGAAPPPPKTTHKALTEGVVATVGPETIAANTVLGIVKHQGLDPKAALDQAVVDAVFAAAAREDLSPAEVVSAERRVLARALFRAMWLEAKDKPITDAELAEATEVRWTRYDRPKGYRTVHFVVEVKPDADTATHEKAEALAKRIREAVLPIAAKAKRIPAPELDEDAMFRRGKTHPDPLVEDWRKAVRAVAADGLSVIPQPLPPITAAGRPIEHNAPLSVNLFAKEYTAQAVALKERGDLTDVFGSYAGYHVAMLLEITPEKRLSREERLAGLREEILRVRGLRARRAILEKLEQQTNTSIPANAEAQLTQVQIQLDEG